MHERMTQRSGPEDLQKIGFCSVSLRGRGQQSLASWKLQDFDSEHTLTKKGVSDRTALL